MLEGTVVTMDALHCVEETFCQIVEDKQGHFLVGVKGNRRKLMETIIAKIDGCAKDQIYTASQHNKGHGRIEYRQIELVTISPKEAGYSHVHSAMRITRKREHLRNGEIFKTEEEVSFYVATFDARETGACRALKLIRGHWSIENRLHHVKDVSMNEDQYRAKGGFARIMTAIRSSVTLLLKSFDMTLPVAQRRFATKTSLLVDFVKCKSLEKFKLRFLG